MSVQGARLLSLIFAGACGLLLLLALALQFGFGRGYRWDAPDEDAAQPVVADAIDRQPFKLPPSSAYADTLQHPLFNEDRQPTPEFTEPPPPQPPVAQLNVALTGVIITPQVHIALLHDNAKNDQMSIKEGSPLPGDLGGWTLTRVKPRSAMFKEASGDEVEVELSTAVASQKPGAPPHPGGAAPAAPGQPPNPPVFGPKPPTPAPAVAKPADTAQAEQMQRRIEERRKQMREEAERLKQQANPQH